MQLRNFENGLTVTESHEPPALIPGADRLELPWAGHFPSLERPAETTRLMPGFLPRA
ncbi:hypothetical protein [Streptomyces sp. NPDC001502]|uniref:hypothetical protein n=1 Tax=Streptomyces sp. NPDC001502 TaxID=3364578 RepID=UPI0036A2C2C7